MAADRAWQAGAHLDDPRVRQVGQLLASCTELAVAPPHHALHQHQAVRIRVCRGGRQRGSGVRRPPRRPRPHSALAAGQLPARPLRPFPRQHRLPTHRLARRPALPPPPPFHASPPSPPRLAPPYPGLPDAPTPTLHVPPVTTLPLNLARQTGPVPRPAAAPRPPPPNHRAPRTRPAGVQVAPVVVVEAALARGVGVCVHPKAAGAALGLDATRHHVRWGAVAAAQVGQLALGAAGRAEGHHSTAGGVRQGSQVCAAAAGQPGRAMAGTQRERAASCCCRRSRCRREASRQARRQAHSAAAPRATPRTWWGEHAQSPGQPAWPWGGPPP